MCVIFIGIFISSLGFPNIPGDAGSTVLYRISPILYIFVYGFVGVVGSLMFREESRDIRRRYSNYWRWV